MVGAFRAQSCNQRTPDWGGILIKRANTMPRRAILRNDGGILRPMQVDDLGFRQALLKIPQEFGGRSGLRDAAVLAPILRREGEDVLLFTLRQPGLRNHSGEVSFPGGAREGRETPLACALREAEEEVGIKPESVTTLGALSPMRSIADFWVQVLVGRVEPSLFTPKLDSQEVAQLLEIPLASLCEPGNWVWKSLPPPPFQRRMPFFYFEGHPLWGLTALFTLEFLERLEGESRINDPEGGPRLRFH